MLQPGVAVEHCKEGTKSSIFWFALGGKQSYKSKNVPHDIIDTEPHLYAFSFKNG
jgi:hypothetical protein